MMRPGIYIYLNRKQLEFLCSRAHLKLVCQFLFQVFIADSQVKVNGGGGGEGGGGVNHIVDRKRANENGQIVKRFCRPDAQPYHCRVPTLMDRLDERSRLTWLHVKFNRLELSNLFTASMCQWQSNEVNEANFDANCLWHPSHGHTLSNWNWAKQMAAANRIAYHVPFVTWMMDARTAQKWFHVKWPDERLRLFEHHSKRND